MQWLLVVVAVCLWTVVLGENAIRCRMRLQDHTCSRNKNGRFFVNGEKIVMKYTDKKFSLNCYGSGVIESPAMPHFRNDLYVPNIEIYGCNVPTENPYSALLIYWNVKQEQRDGEASLILSGFNSSQVLTPEHFMDLGNLTSLELKADELMPVDRDIFSLLPNLRSLRIASVSLPNITDGTAIQSLVTPILQKLQLLSWKEIRFAPLTKCESLLQLEVFKTNVKELPEKWLAACPVLETVTLKFADHLTSLPQKLFEGATALKRITLFRLVNIESLPEGFLDGVPNLVSFEMAHGHLKTLSSNLFRGLNNLHSVTLSYNKLTAEAMQAFSGLTSLTKLDVSQNSNIGDVCDENGYSSLRNLVHLKEISFKITSITRICRDWREDLAYLEWMDLRNTKITELTFDDLQFKRNLTSSCHILLDESDITSIRFTEDDYKKLLTSSRPEIPIYVSGGFEENLTCDCNMYWTRKALDVARFTHVIPADDLRCGDNTYFMKKTPEQICPERARA